METNTTKYNWDTQFETANNTMTHTFSQRVQVVSNIKNGEAQLIVDGILMETYHKMPVKEYERMLLAVEEYANGLHDRKTNACKMQRWQHSTITR